MQYLFDLTWHYLALSGTFWNYWPFMALSDTILGYLTLIESMHHFFGTFRHYLIEFDTVQNHMTFSDILWGYLT